MLLELPIVSTTISPDWASDLNTAIEDIDEHDHSSGKGVRITPAGLDINTSLDISNQTFYNFKSVRFQLQGATLTGAGNANSLYSVSGNLYFTNNAGTAVQLTSGGSIASTPGSASVFEPTSVNTNLTIGAGDTYVILLVDTTASRAITLPLASAVSNGRIYIIKDVSGQSETNNITLNRAGSDLIDGASSQVLNSNYGSWMIVGDEVSNWYII
jgi:hypothetical protein